MLDQAKHVGGELELLLAGQAQPPLRLFNAWINEGGKVGAAAPSAKPGVSPAIPALTSMASIHRPEGRASTTGGEHLIGTDS